MFCWKKDLEKAAVVMVLLVPSASCSEEKYSAERESWDIALGFIEILQPEEYY